MFRSTPSLFELPWAHLPSIFEQHRSQAGHRGSGLQAEPGWKVGSYGFGEQETSYLDKIVRYEAKQN